MLMLFIQVSLNLSEKNFSRKAVKKIKKIIILFILIIGLVGCSQYNKEIKIISEKDTFNIGTKDISFEILNESKNEIEVGNTYDIMKYENGSWITVPIIHMQDLFSSSIEPGERKTFSISLYPDQYKYSSGRYKVVKEAYDRNKNKFKIEFQFKLK